MLATAEVGAVNTAGCVGKERCGKNKYGVSAGGSPRAVVRLVSWVLRHSGSSGWCSGAVGDGRLKVVGWCAANPGKSPLLVDNIPR